MWVYFLPTHVASDLAANSPKMEEFLIYRVGLEAAQRADQILMKFFPFLKIL